jgi:hypothetical protein
MFGIINLLIHFHRLNNYMNFKKEILQIFKFTFHYDKCFAENIIYLKLKCYINNLI